MNDLTLDQLDELARLEEAATAAPWELSVFGSGSVTVNMRWASGGVGPPWISEATKACEDGFIGAAVQCHRLAAFETLCGDTEQSIQNEKCINGKLIAASRNHLRALISMARRTVKAEAQRDEYKRLYEFRGKVITRPCMKCGHVPKKVTLAEAQEGKDK